MEDLLRDIENCLHDNGFDFNLESKRCTYNPLEHFVDHVREKEICHSYILEDLLNEYGQHDCKKLFLDSFLKMINCQTPNGVDITVKRERKISRSFTNGGERSIDLVLSWDYRKKKYAIIIENKMNGAPFQPYQLEEYKQSLEKEGCIVQSVVVLYDKKTQYGDGVVSLCSLEISKWLNDALELCDKSKSTYWGIKAYAQMVDNMAKKNINMVNADSIVEMAHNNPESYAKLTQIVNAYNELENAVYNELRNARQLKGFKSEIKSHEVSFWIQEDYERNDLVVTVCFSQNQYWLYIVNDRYEKDRSRTLSKINFEKYDESKQCYKPIKESDWKYSFPENTDRLIRKIKKVINDLKSING